MGIVVTGANGQLGRALREVYPAARYTNRGELDIANADSVAKFDWSKIKTVINAAAYTAVDQSETTEGMKAAWQSNSQGVANLAAAARQHNLTLVHVSTDYVFDGEKAEAYTEDDIINPQGIYGRSKAAGELAASAASKHYIVRTSWVIGDGNNFVRTMLKLSGDHDELTVVNDQMGRPTFTSDLARGIKHLIDTKSAYGIYNLTNSGRAASWADFARTIFETAQINCRVKPISTAEYAAGKDPWAPRPTNSMLELTKIEKAGFSPPDWQAGLEEYIKTEKEKT